MEFISQVYSFLLLNVMKLYYSKPAEQATHTHIEVQPVKEMTMLLCKPDFMPVPKRPEEGIRTLETGVKWF